MANEIISHLEMCRREGVSLQRGMNFGLGGHHSVILLIRRAGLRPPERVRVCEKLRQGIWSYNGVFHLMDEWRQVSSGR